MCVISIIQTFLAMLALIQDCKPISRDIVIEPRRSLNYSENDNLRIINSGETSMYEYTFMAVLVTFTDPRRRSGDSEKAGKGKLVCGGAIIHKLWIVTAARCFNNKSDKQHFEVYAGTIDLSSEVGQQIRQIDSIAIHPQYHRSSDEFNLAMVKVSSPFTTSTYVRAGYLPVGPLSITGTERCHILGFVREYDSDIDEEIVDNKYDERLIKVQLHAIDHRECADRLKVLKAHQPYKLTDKNFCLIQIEEYPHNNSQGACEGDVGGPCICGFKIQGVIAHYTNKSCYTFGYPSTMVDVGHHLNWIRANILQLNVVSTNMGLKITNKKYKLKIFYVIILLLHCLICRYF